jgi:hypothetical protein
MFVLTLTHVKRLARSNAAPPRREKAEALVPGSTTGKLKTTRVGKPLATRFSPSRFKKIL